MYSSHVAQRQRARIGMREDFAYKAFVSYSHAVDGELGRSLERALESFAKPWYRRRSIRVFRDQTTLSLTPHLWESIEQSLEQSEFLILLASPQAAKSQWVSREAAYWLSHRSADTILIVLTDGELIWDNAQGTFDHTLTTALPGNLIDAFHGEPLYADLRWLRTVAQLSDRDARYLDTIATLAATLHRVPKDEMVGEDIVQHRRVKRITLGAVTALAILAVAATVASYLAIDQRDIALERERIATARQLALQSAVLFDEDPNQIERSALLAIESLRMHWSAIGQRNLRNALTLFPNVTQLFPDDDHLYSIKFSADGSLLANASEHGVTVWHIASNRHVGIHDSVRVRRVAFSPDGNTIATAGEDNSARLWDAESGEEIAVFEHSAPVVAVDFSPSGQLLATGSARDDHAARIYDINSGEIVLEWQAGNEEIRDVAFSKSGRWLGAIATDGPIAVFDRDLGWKRVELERAAVGVGLDLAFSDDERYFAGTRDNRAAIWSLEDGAYIGEVVHSDFRGEANMAFNVWINKVVFSPDSKLLATAGRDGTARIWDPTTGEEVARLSHSTSVEEIRFTPDGQYIITASYDGTRLWQLPQGTEVTRLTFDTGYRVLDVNADGSSYASAGPNGTIALWQPGRVDRVATMRHGDDVELVACSADGMQIVTADDSNLIRVWNRDGSQVQGVASLFNSYSVRFDPSGQYVMVNGQTGLYRIDINNNMTPQVIAGDLYDVAFNGSFAVTLPRGNHSVDIWNLITGENARNLGAGDAQNPIAISSDGQYFASTHVVPSSTNGHDWIVRVSSTSDLKPVWETQPGYSADEIAISQTGRYVVPYNGNKAILASAAAPNELIELAFDGNLESVSFDSTEKRVFGVADQNVYVWTIGTGKNPVVLAHNAPVRFLDIGDNGQYVVSASGAVVSVWDLSDGSLVSQWSTGGRVAQLCFLDDDKYVVTGDTNDEAIIWRWQKFELVDPACELLSRNFSQAEWTRYFGDAPFRETCPNLRGR